MYFVDGIALARQWERGNKIVFKKGKPADSNQDDNNN